ncbi:MAG: maleylpyruvate isomerase family mycothiol-dependent enzyme [Actinomycetota bacterium]|nr:maleylpyruvate isomerase family mycothiol-dependent enzyme [Actinomycetota bacterium]
MEHLPYLGNAMTRMAENVGKAEGDEVVPACPGWTINDLTVHLGTMHRWAASIVLSGQRLPEPQVVATEPLLDWYAGTATALLAALQAVEPTEPTPNFSLINETAAFWPRRQMHETTIHSVDAAQALGLGEDYFIDEEVADDGIDEVLSVYFPRMTARGHRPDVSARVRVTATDTGRSWIVAPSSDPAGTPILLHPTLEFDAELSGTAADLYLGLWRRSPHVRLKVDGDAADRILAGPMTP